VGPTRKRDEKMATKKKKLAKKPAKRTAAKKPAKKAPKASVKKPTAAAKTATAAKGPSGKKKQYTCSECGHPGSSRGHGTKHPADWKPGK
jgi:cytochrome c5